MLEEHLADVPDPRDPRGVRHALAVVSRSPRWQERRHSPQSVSGSRMPQHVLEQIGACLDPILPN